MIVLGYIFGYQKGLKEGNQNGVIQGVKMIYSEEIYKAENGGLSSTLDWETTQRMLNEKMSKN